MRKIPKALCTMAIALALAALNVPALTPQELPLVQKTDITYLGAFALPLGTFGTSRFGYGGLSISAYKDPATNALTLFMQGHIQNPGQIAQVAVPSTLVNSAVWANLPVAKVLQNFADVSENKLSTVGDAANAILVYGTLVYNGRLIVAVSQYYGSDQHSSHGASGLDLSVSGDFKGFYGFTGAVAPPRALGGWMALIPAEWQPLLGGTALTGNGAIPIISATSVGPSATVFNPDDIGTKDPVPGKTVLFYPLGQGTMIVNNEASQNDTFNLTSRIAGMAFPAGSRSLLYFGGHGTGPYCYGTPQECGNDSALADTKGPHAQPYRYQIWAYDANDLLAVKNGTKQTYGPKPYAVWPMNDFPTHFVPVSLQGAGYDPESGQWFIATDYGEQPRIEVYRINVSGTTAQRPSTQSTNAPLEIVVKHNPFSGKVNIAMQGDDIGAVSVYSVQGTCLFHERIQGSGRAVTLAWDASKQRPGIYIVKVVAGGRTFIRQVTLLR